MGITANTCITLVLRPERKTSSGRPRCRWEDNIKIDVKFWVVERPE
jgi:hypothetical protein